MGNITKIVFWCSIFFLSWTWFNASFVYAQNCALNGEICYPNEEVDVATCKTNNYGDGCVRSPWDRDTPSCNGSNTSCYTYSHPCSSNDNCTNSGTPGGYAICGWNGSSCQDEYCSACSRATCCGPGGGSPTPTPPPLPTSPPPEPSPTIGPTPADICPSCSNFRGAYVDPNTVAINGTVNAGCDFGRQYTNFSPGGSLFPCFFTGWSGTMANFSCDAPGIAGNYTHTCGSWATPDCPTPVSCSDGDYIVVDPIPSCLLNNSGSQTVCVGDTTQHLGFCEMDFGNITAISLNKTVQSSNSPSPVNVCGGFSSSAATCPPSGTFPHTWDTSGSYYYYVNGRSNTGSGCTGSPFCSTFPCTIGASSYDADCGVDDLLSVTVEPIDQPIGLTANVTCAGCTSDCGSCSPNVSLSWGAANCASTYEVYRCSGSGCDPETGLLMGSTSLTTFTDTVADANGTNEVYRYAVKPCNGAVCASSGAFSAPVEIAPACPCCGFSFVPPTLNIAMGGSVQLIAIPYEKDSTIAYSSDGTGGLGVSFSIVSGTSVSINPTSPNCLADPSGQNCIPPYFTTVQGIGIGSATIQAQATTSISSFGAYTCTETISSSTYIAPWWQAEGNVTSRGSIGSDISLNAVPIPSSASPYLIVDNDGDANDDPGLLVYDDPGNDPYLGTGGAGVSSTDSRTNSNIRYRPEITFKELYDKLPDDVLTGINTISGSTFDISSVFSPTLTVSPTRGYFVFYYDGSASGDLTITASSPLPDSTVLTTSTRIVIFVENADLNIGSNINSLTRGKSSILFIVEGDGSESLGDYSIRIEPTVGHVLADRTNPDLEGIFYTDGTFASGHDTAADDVSLHVRGAVSANAFELERDLGGAVGAQNDLLPAEYFEYGTEQVFAFPSFLRYRPYFWREGVL